VQLLKSLLKCEAKEQKTKEEQKQKKSRKSRDHPKKPFPDFHTSEP
jgi:hypothetical protein